MAEQIVLDPSEVASSRTQLDITPWLGADGVDWGDASIAAYMSSQLRGDVPVDYRVPNREIAGGLVFNQTQGGTTTSVARANIQAKLALFQREGGWIKRITNNGGTVYADVVNAVFRATSLAGWASRSEADPGSSFSLECLPDFYGDEVDLGDNSTTTASELIFTETGIEGDYPGRVRIVVDEDDSDDQRGLIWAFRSRHYSASANASMEYEAEELGVLDTATKAALSGASGGTAVTHGTLSTSWTPVMTGRIGGTTYPIHTGSYQLFARLYSTSGTTVRARSVWDVGDLVNPTENTPYRLPGSSNFYIADLGEVRLDPAPVGTHRWDYQIQGAGDAGAENLSVDKVWIVNKDEGMGRLRAPTSIPQGLATYSARSEFTTESGAITGDSLAIGGNWTVVTNSDADDFSVAAGEATRSVVSDSGSGAGIFLGRGVTAGSTNYTNIVASIDVKHSATGTNLPRSALVFRVVDSSNYFLVYLFPTSTSTARVDVNKYVAGAQTILGSTTIPFSAGSYYTISGQVLASGFFLAKVGLQGAASPLASFTGYDSTLSTGGVLATGRIGMADSALLATADTRTYDNFAAWVPQPDALMFANQSAQLTTDGMYREDAGGTAYGPVSEVVGDLPRIPPAGLEGRTTEVFLKGSRGDLDQLSDSGIDDISARVFYRPSWLFVDN